MGAPFIADLFGTHDKSVGAKMGQTTRQSMPSNAQYAFMQPTLMERHSP